MWKQWNHADLKYKVKLPPWKSYAWGIQKAQNVMHKNDCHLHGYQNTGPGLFLSQCRCLDTKLLIYHFSFVFQIQLVWQTWLSSWLTSCIDTRSLRTAMRHTQVGPVKPHPDINHVTDLRCSPCHLFRLSSGNIVTLPLRHKNSSLSTCFIS